MNLDSPPYISHLPVSMVSSRLLPPADIGYTYSPENANPSVNPVIYSIQVRNRPEVVSNTAPKFPPPPPDAPKMTRLAGRF